MFNERSGTVIGMALVKRIGNRLAKVSAEELAVVVDGLNEIIDLTHCRDSLPWGLPSSPSPPRRNTHIAACISVSMVDMAALPPDEELVTRTLTGGGLLWAAVFILTRNLWATTANHAAWNFTILLCGVPLSGNEDWRTISPLTTRYAGPDWLTGGMFGPESSLLAIASTAVVVALLLCVERRRAPWFKPGTLGTKSADSVSAKPTGVTESPL